MNNGNYMNNGLPYDTNLSQYHHSWGKPDNQYFPRGEAPPPYDEVCAQTDTINAQCTVRYVCCLRAFSLTLQFFSPTLFAKIYFF